jgi:hypothetical protein
MLCGSHVHLDGRGCLYLLDALFSALANPGEVSFGDEASRLPPSEDYLYGCPETYSEQDAQNAMMVLGRLVQDRPIGLPVQDIKQPPRDNRREELKLPTATTNAIIHACKQKGFTVTAAWHTAVVLAASKIQAAAGEVGTSFASVASFDLRPYFPEWFDPRSQPVSQYGMAPPILVEPKHKSFDEIAKEIRDKYKTEVSPVGERASVMFAGTEIAGPMMASEAPSSTTPVTSSLGVIEKFLKRVHGQHWELIDVWVGDSMLTPDTLNFLWTWRERMVLSTSYNSAFYTDVDIQAFLSTIKDELVRGLGVKE